MSSSIRCLLLALSAAALPITASAAPMRPAEPTKAATATSEAEAAPAVATATATATPPPAQRTQPQPQQQQTAIAVSAWRFSQTAPGGGAPPAAQTASVGRPLYLWLTLDGGQAAIDRMRAGGKVAIQVHWASENPNSHAPALTTSLDVGRPDIAATLAGQVAKTGHFEWHSWTRKDSLSPGRWTVSLTGPDGQPITCGQASGPCQLSIDVS